MSKEQLKILATISWTKASTIGLLPMTMQLGMISWCVRNFRHLARIASPLTYCQQHFGDDSRSDSPHDSQPSAARLDTRKVVNAVITKSFNSSPEEVQTQALEVPFELSMDVAELTKDSSLSGVGASSVVLPFI
jgi:hypothetical protein